LVLGAYIAFLALTPTFFTLKGSRNLTVEFVIEAENKGTLQFFYDSGKGFNERESIKKNYGQGVQKVSVELPYTPIRALRIDPQPQRDKFTLGAVYINDRSLEYNKTLSPLQCAAVNDADVEIQSDSALVLITGSSDPSIVYEGVTFEPNWIRHYGSLFVLFIVLGMILSAGGLVIERTMHSAKPGTKEIIWTVSAGVILFVSRVPTFSQPLLDWHDFRQTQTALSAFWIAKDGLNLPTYPLPLFGEPWSAPFEFPLYQLVVSSLFAVGVPIDTAARVISTVCYAAAVSVFSILLRRAGAPLFVCACVWILVFVSPFSLVYSKAALIESTAVLCGCLFLLAVMSIIQCGWTRGRVIYAIATGCLTGLVKITTLAAFLVPICLLAAWRSESETSRIHFAGRTLARTAFSNVIGWICVLGVPIVVAVCWSKMADNVKLASAATEWLSSRQLHAWNFGSIEQRFSVGNWAALYARVSTDVLPWIWPFALIGVVGTKCLSAVARILMIGCVLGIIVPILTFFNLYVVHDYYLAAVYLFLCFSTGVGIYSLRCMLGSARWGIVLLLGLGPLLVMASANSELVRLSYLNPSTSEILEIGASIQENTSDNDVILVAGDDWNARIPYYARRRAIMLREGSAFDSGKFQSVLDSGVRIMVVGRATRLDMSCIVPVVTLIKETPGFKVYKLQSTMEPLNKNAGPQHLHSVPQDKTW
jgi:hypothetical protein